MTIQADTKSRPVRSQPLYDVLCVGEIVVDLRSERSVPSLRYAQSFRRFLGGAPVNVARNISRLGGKAALMGAVGADVLGDWVLDTLTEEGVDTRYIFRSSRPSSLVLVTRHSTTPDFLPYRGADPHFRVPEDVDTMLSRIRAVHTTAFALSQQPAREHIFALLQAAYEARIPVSFDPNFHPMLWDEPEQAQAHIARAVSFAYIVKPSVDDCYRLFGAVPYQVCGRHFLDWGAEHVFITQGARGVQWMSRTGEEMHVPARDVPIVDVTGAGDAFWTGILLGFLDGLTPVEAAQMGQHIAEYVIQSPESVIPPLSRSALYQTLGIPERR